MNTIIKIYWTFILFLSANGTAIAQDLPSWVSPATRAQIQQVQQQQRRQQQPTQRNAQPMNISPTTRALINSYNQGQNMRRVNNSDYSINNSSVGDTKYNFAGATDTRGTSSSSSSSTRQNSSSSTKMCGSCYGNGRCSQCSGKGWHYGGYGNGSKHVSCSSCSGKGVCRWCNGTGRK